MENSLFASALKQQVGPDDAFEDSHIIYVDKRDYSKWRKKTCLRTPGASLQHQSAPSLCFLVTYFIK